MHMELTCKQQNNENMLFRFFHYIWFIENLCFILILKQKMTKF